jgi:hypothetical protein
MAPAIFSGASWQEEVDKAAPINLLHRTALRPIHSILHSIRCLSQAHHHQIFKALLDHRHSKVEDIPDLHPVATLNLLKPPPPLVQERDES